MSHLGVIGRSRVTFYKATGTLVVLLSGSFDRPLGSTLNLLHTLLISTERESNVAGSTSGKDR